MKFGVYFVNVGGFARPDKFSHLVTTAERLGFESIWTIEHVVIPVGYQATYPYHRGGKLPLPEDIDLGDPLLPLAYAAAQTEKIKFGTGVVILPQRHPLYMAKEAATLDMLSNGRFMLGVGIGWMKDEFDALNIPFDERVARTEESIQAMRSLWQPEPAAFNGQFFRWGPLQMNPKPTRPGGVPIVIGGHSSASARRAARLGDGFFPAVFSSNEYAALREALLRECDRIGRDPAEIETTAAIAGPDPEIIAGYEALGVSRLLTGYRLDGSDSLAATTERLAAFAERAITGS